MRGLKQNFAHKLQCSFYCWWNNSSLYVREREKITYCSKWNPVSPSVRWSVGGSVSQSVSRPVIIAEKSGKFQLPAPIRVLVFTHPVVAKFEDFRCEKILNSSHFYIYHKLLFENTYEKNAPIKIKLFCYQKK